MDSWDARSYRATYREYVAAIYELAEEGLVVIQARIAAWLGVSRPSVSEMMPRMADDKSGIAATVVRGNLLIGSSPPDRPDRRSRRSGARSPSL